MVKNLNKKQWVISVLCLAMTTQLNALNAIQPLPSSTTTAKPIITQIKTPFTKDTLPDNIQTALTASHLPPDSVSIIVQPLSKTPTQPKPFIQYHADTPRTPASTQKLIPTLIALDSLGKDFRWQTQLWINGAVIGDTLHGDVIVKGGGNPKLEDDQLGALLANLKSHGISHIDGNVIVDNSIFRQVSFNINAFDGKGSRPYNAMPNGLLLNYGTLTVDLTPQLAHDNVTKNSLLTQVPTAVRHAIDFQPEPTQAIVVPPKTINTEENIVPPAHTFQQFNVKITPNLADYTAPKQATADPKPCRGMTEEKLVQVGKDELKLLTTPSINCGENQAYWLTYPDADSLIVKAVKGHIREQFADFGGEVLLKNSDNLPTASQQKNRFWQNIILPRLIAVHQSAPLSEQIHDINHFSNNVMIEQVALSLPVYADNQPYSSYPKTFDYMQRWWQTHLPNHKPPVMTRASGLCRDCEVTPDSLMAVLTYAYGRPDFATYQTSMGLGGVSGTIKGLKLRQPENPAIGRSWIKTGTLENVASMAGYVQGQSGKWYAVVGMINSPNIMYNWQAKAVLDEMLAWTASQ